MVISRMICLHYTTRSRLFVDAKSLVFLGRRESCVLSNNWRSLLDHMWLSISRCCNTFFQLVDKLVPTRQPRMKSSKWPMVTSYGAMVQWTKQSILAWVYTIHIYDIALNKLEIDRMYVCISTYVYIYIYMDIYKDTCFHKYFVWNLALRFARPSFVEGQVPSILCINLKTSFHIATFKDNHKKQRQPPKTSTWISISWYRCDRIHKETRVWLMTPLHSRVL